MDLYSSTLAYGIDTFVSLALQIDRRLVAAEQRGHIRSHLGLAGTDLGPLADDRDVGVGDGATSLMRPRDGIAHKNI